jgi:hypothetical protein
VKYATSVLLADLKNRIDTILAAARKQGHDEALANIRALVGETGVSSGRRGPGRPKDSMNKPRRARKNSWTGLSPDDRLARVNAIRKGKGLPPRSA